MSNFVTTISISNRTRCVSYGTVVDSTEASQFLGYVASVPYASASPSEARVWVENNIGQSVTSTFGSARFEMIANPDTPLVRMLIISP